MGDEQPSHTGQPLSTVDRSSVVHAVHSFAGKLKWWVSALMGSAVIVVLSVPRMLNAGTSSTYYPWFRGHDGRVVEGLVVDHTQYLRLWEQFSGVGPGTDLRPFSSRALTPWLASRLPLDPQLSIWMVNILALAVGTFALALLARSLSGSNARTAVAVALWSVSVPVFWYTGRPWVDPAAAAAAPIVLLAAYRGRKVGLIAGVSALVLAVWAKETAVLIVPAAMTCEWLAPGRSSVTRALRASSWAAAAVTAWATKGLLSGGGHVVFAPWVPDHLSTMTRFLRLNLFTPGRSLQFLATAGPSIAGVTVWVRRRRMGLPTTDVPTAAPLVVAIVTALTMATWSLVSALFDGRTAWVALAPGVLLLALALPRPRTNRVAPVVRRRRAVTAAAILGGIAVVVISAGAVVRLTRAPTGPLLEDPDPRIARPLPGRVPIFETVSGSGDATIQLPESSDEAIIVRFESSETLEALVDGTPTAAAATQGTLFLDSPVADELQIRTDGDWELTVTSLDAGFMWDALSPVHGDGPAVLVIPWSLPRSVDVDFQADPPGASARFVGRCKIDQCGELGGDRQMPAGTEVLVVDAAGPWSLTPEGPTEPEQARVLPGTHSG